MVDGPGVDSAVVALPFVVISAFNRAFAASTADGAGVLRRPTRARMSCVQVVNPTPDSKHKNKNSKAINVPLREV